MPASIAFTGQIGLYKILKNCSWKNHTTFSEFYLKDMTQVHDDLDSLGPLVAAQKVVAPWVLRKVVCLPSLPCRSAL